MKVRNVINLLDFLQVSSKGSKLGLEEASSGEKLSSLARLSKDVINRFPSRYYLTEDGGVLKWNNRLAKTSTACSGLHVQLGLVTETVEKSYRDDAV